MQYDISIPVTEGVAVWPGDTPYHFALSWKISDGEAVNVGTVTMSVHTGTHIDAPYHFTDLGTGAGELDIRPFLGPAVVVDVTGLSAIGPETLAGIDFSRTPRVLLKTGGWRDHSIFPESIPTLTPEAVTVLARGGAVLIGVDVPSVDSLDSKTLPNHNALHAANIRILESADLRNVPPGIYNLVALPLRLLGSDGSPVRAILTDTL